MKFTLDCTPRGQHVKENLLRSSVPWKGSLVVFDSDNILTNGVTGDAIAATPLPTALPLFASGLDVIGCLAKRRKDKNNAAIAAA